MFEMELPLEPKTEAPKSIEEQANSQENPSLLLFSRLRNPKIFEQLVSVYQKKYSEDLAHNPDLLERIKELLKERIEKIEKSTYIDPDVETSHGIDADLLFHGSIFEISDDDFNSETIKTPFTGEGFFEDGEDVSDIEKNKIQAIIESHEKGHFVRQFSDIDYFAEGFDINAIPVDYESITPEDIERYREETGFSVETAQDVVESQLKGYLFNGSEIAERMSQLKAYFGMKGAEKFTKEHLDYARKHYVGDTRMDNNMGVFFQAITPETEEKFLELINNSGI